MTILIVLVALSLAASNGANDNFKGFATVWGSDTLSYRKALWTATVATLAGSLMSLLLADTLVQTFSGRGLVPDALVMSPSFVASAGAGAALTVMLATRVGLPISTTHALIGGLLGAGLALNGGTVAWGTLAKMFVLPLLLSPIAAALLAGLAYRLAVRRQSAADCICITAPSMALADGTVAALSDQRASVVVASAADCADVPMTTRFSLSRILSEVHLGSAVTICFARAVNDTPKLAAILLAARALDPSVSWVLVGGAMMIGGLVAGRRVARTMSLRISRLDSAQGLSANLVTAFLVLAASRFGLPVSTTHVSVGSIAGVGFGASSIEQGTLRHIVLSWIATLPLACAGAWLLANLLN